MHALRLTIGKHATSIYALESMLYLTTGIMDKYDNTNIDLETAIFKVNQNQNIKFLNFAVLNSGAISFLFRFILKNN